jgi:hypothetical protein
MSFVPKAMARIDIKESVMIQSKQHDNVTSELGVEAEELLEALKGPASDVAAMDVASKWLRKLEVDGRLQAGNDPELAHRRTHR